MTKNYLLSLGWLHDPVTGELKAYFSKIGWVKYQLYRILTKEKVHHKSTFEMTSHTESQVMKHIFFVILSFIALVMMFAVVTVSIINRNLEMLINIGGSVLLTYVFLGALYIGFRFINFISKENKTLHTREKD